MTKKLTIKQAKFVKEFLLNGNGNEAYRQAYNASKMSAKAISVEVNKLLKNPSIALEIEKDREKLQKEFEVTAEQKRKKLWDIIEGCAKEIPVPLKGSQDEEGNANLINMPADPKAAISAIAELNKMDGHLAAIKQDINANVQMTHEEMLEQLK